MAESKSKSEKTTADDGTFYDQAVEVGYWGDKVDPRPNEHYTVEGSIARSDTEQEPK